MNTYDFDQTIFNPDSSYKFFMFCLRKYPAGIKRLPRTLYKAVLYKLKKIPTKELKEQIFSFLQDIPEVDAAVDAFWDENFGNIEKWYLEQKKDDDIIISASPEFLLEPACKRLGVRLIATPMDKKTGKIHGENCHDSEKVRRFREAYPDAHTECFYSDSLSDTPMAEIADRAYIVKKDKISPWPAKT